MAHNCGFPMLAELVARHLQSVVPWYASVHFMQVCILCKCAFYAVCIRAIFEMKKSMAILATSFRKRLLDSEATM